MRVGAHPIKTYTYLCLNEDFIALLTKKTNIL